MQAYLRKMNCVFVLAMHNKRRNVGNFPYLREYTFPTGCVENRIQGVSFSVRVDYIVMGAASRQSESAWDMN